MANAKKVLLIEDDTYLAADLKFFIEDEGHEITICSDTDEILQIYPKIDTFDTIILGLMMLKGETFLINEKEEEKELDVGEILYNKIRKDFPEKHILILTSKSLQDIKVKIEKAYFIQKPVTEEKIKAILSYIQYRICITKINERFVLENKIYDDYIWYVCRLEYYDNPASNWILGSTDTQKRENAMQFCKSKAEILAKVLSSQEDEEGYSSQYKVVKV